MTEQKILDKIAKLLRLADPERGGTDAERELAMQRANELMAKYNVSSFESTQQSAEGDVSQDADIIEGIGNQWQAKFMLVTAEVCLVNGYYVQLARNRSKVVFVGRPDNIAFVKQLHEHLIPWLMHEAREGVRAEQPHNPKAYKRAFFDAATRRIHGRLEAQRRQVSGKYGTAMVRNEKAANAKFLEEQGIQLRRSRGRGYSNSAGHAGGADAGNRADISPGRKLGAGR